jgi:hypothetical protein
MIGSFYRLVFPIILIAADFCNEPKEPVEYGAMQHLQKKEGGRRSALICTWFFSSLRCRD